MPLPVEDVVAIQQLAARYNHLVDAGEGEAWADLWVDDGVLDTGMGMSIEGRDALVEFATNVPVMVPGTRHLVTNLVVEGAADAATARTYLQMWATSAEPAQTSLVISGVYHDELRKDAGGWRYVRRVLVPDPGPPG